MNAKRVLIPVMILMIAMVIYGCGSTEKEAADEHPNSGPITVSVEDESEAIKKAPAYDVEAARAFIDDMPEIREIIDSVEDENGLTAFGEVAPSQASLDKLQAEIDKLSADDHKVSLIMVDLTTKSGVAYKSAIKMCSQSTVKAIYCGALLENRPEALKENGAHMRDAIEFSLNDPYKELRAIYGTEPIVKWCEEVGVDASFAEPNFPRDKTARDMFKLWTRLYCFLNGDKDPDNFAKYYADSSCSATKKQLGDRFPVQTKAGWERGLDEALNYDPNAELPAEYIDKNPENDETAINDTGVVYTDNGPYMFVIYTDHPFGVYRDYTSPNPLYALAETLYEVQTDIATGK